MIAVGDRRTQVLKGALDLCVLAVLDDGPVYGYGLIAALEERGLVLVAEGTSYPLLSRLEKAGLVTTYREASSGGPPRKYYLLTEAGRQELLDAGAEWRTVTAEIDRVLGVRR